MKAISVLQPWATLIIEHGKDCENRTWATSHKGPIVIVSSARFEHGWTMDDLDEILLLAHPGMKKGDYPDLRSTCPLGHALGIVDIVSYDRERKSKWDVDGQWHWRLANPRPFHTPFPVKGRMSLYEIADHLVDEALRGVAQ